MVSLLSVAQSAEAEQNRMWRADESAEAERNKPFLLKFFEQHFPYYWEKVGLALNESRACLLECQELGLQPLPAVEIGEFFLALDVTVNYDRKVVVLTQESTPRVVGVVEISADQTAFEGPEGLSPADARLTEVLHQNLS